MACFKPAPQALMMGPLKRLSQKEQLFTAGCPLRVGPLFQNAARAGGGGGFTVLWVGRTDATVSVRVGIGSRDLRARYSSSNDMVHRLFVCISGR